MNKPRSPTQIHLQSPACEDKEINHLIRDYIENVVAGFGGWSEVTPGEMAMLVSQRICLLSIYRCQAAMAKLGPGMLDDKGKLSQYVWLSSRYQSEFRSGQVALGLSRPRITTRRPKDLAAQPRDTIAAITEEYAEKQKAEKRQLKVV